jgi:hypothetical protein
MEMEVRIHLFVICLHHFEMLHTLWKEPLLHNWRILDRPKTILNMLLTVNNHRSTHSEN